MLHTVIINAKCSDCKHLINEGIKNFCRCEKGNWFGISYNYKGQRISQWDRCMDYHCKFAYEEMILRNQIKRIFKEGD